MRKLLNTLYVTSPDTYLALDGENLVVRKDEKEAMRLPLHNLEGIAAFGYTGASPALMGACAKRGISLCFLTQSGRFLARVTGEVKGNVTLRKSQYAFSEQEEALRGMEGKGAELYFGVFDQLILQQKESFFFATRSRRPPMDNVNAMLSFLYTICSYEVAAALETVGLDPYVGFLHRDRPGWVSLALDLMEELRSVLVDRLVVSLINKREVNAKGFQRQENGAVTMEDATRKTIITAWQSRKREMITHPYLGKRIPWGLVPYVQATLLARYLRGDLDAYPPFFWK